MGRKKTDNMVRVAVITAIGTVAVALITALIAPLALKSLDRTPTSGEVDRPFSTFKPDPAKVYVIRSVYSDKVLTVRAGSEENDAPIIQSDWVAAAHQQWRFEALSGVDAGYYLIYSAKSNKCLDVIGSTPQDSGEVIQYTCGNTDNQKWRFVIADSGVMILEVKHSGKVLDVADDDNGIPATQFSYHGGKKQQWIASEVDP
jgi:hypothetical protein